jgi:protein transport protein SEC24
LELSVVGEDTCIAIELEHRVGGLPKKESQCFVQSALLYTTVTGQRRVRVSTLALKVATSAADVYRATDFGAVTAFLTRQAIAHVWDQRNDSNPLEVARKELTEKTTKILAGYRLNTNALNLPEGQLILPDRLQLLPLFSMALLKSAILRSSFPKRGSGIRATHPNPHADDRAYALFYGSSVNPATSMLMVHPNIFSISNLIDGAGEWQVPQMDSNSRSPLVQAAHHAYVQLPPSVQPSIACIQDDQVYLIDDGMNVYLFVGQDVKAEVKRELLETTNAGCIISSASDFGQQVARLVWQIRAFSSIGPGSEASTLRPTFAPVIVVQYHSSHKDPFERKVMNLMVDDQIGGESDYVDFLVECHKLVRGMVTRGSID